MTCKFLIAIWVVKYETTRVALISRDETYCGGKRRKDGERIFLAQCHDDKSSARTTLEGVVTLARHNLFLLATPRALKTLPKKSGGKTAEKSGDGGGNARPRWIIAATLPCEFNRTYCCEKCFVSAPQSRALHFRVQLYPRMLREMLLILVYFNMWRMDFIKFANHSKWNWTSCYFICALKSRARRNNSLGQLYIHTYTHIYIYIYMYIYIYIYIHRVSLK